MSIQLSEMGSMKMLGENSFNERKKITSIMVFGGKKSDLKEELPLGR